LQCNQIEKGLKVGEASTQETRPMTLGEILSRTLRIYRQSWRVFLLLSLMIVSISFIVRLGFNTWLHYQQRGMPAKTVALSSQSIFVGRIGTIIIQFFDLILGSAFFIATVNAITGRKLAFGDLLREGFRHPSQLAILSFLRVLIYSIIPAVPFLFFVWWVNEFRTYEFASPTANPAGTGLISIAYLIDLLVMLFLGISFELSVCAFVQENLTPWQALKRGWNLADEARGKMTIICVLIGFVGLCLLLLILIIDVFFQKVFSILKTGFLWGAPLKVLMHQIELIPIYLLLIWVFPIALTLIYFDQRIRQEGITFAEILRGHDTDAQEPADAEKMNPDPLVDLSGVIK
jgi:hypothetical protein